MKFLSGLVHWIITCYTVLFGLAVILTACFSMSTRIAFRIRVENDLFDYYPQAFPLHALAVAGILALLMYAAGKRGNRDTGRSHAGLAAALALFVSAFGLFLIFAVHPVATNDALQLEEIMRQFEAGNYISLTRGYLRSYPFQVPYVLCGIALAKVFGPINYTADQLLNILFILLTLWFLYRITWELFEDRRICRMMLLLSFGALCFYVYSTFVYSDVASFPLQVGAVYFEMLYLKRRRAAWMIPAALLITAGILLKSNCYVALIAMDAMLVFSALRTLPSSRKGKRSASGARSLWINLALALIVTAAAVSAPRAVNRRYSRLAGSETDIQGVPAMAYLAMGAQETEGKYGWYNGYNVSVFWQAEGDASKASEAASEALKESIAHFLEFPKYGVKFYLYKYLSQWGDATCISTRELEEAGRNHPEISPLADSLLFGDARSAMEMVMGLFHSVLWIGTVLYLFSLIKRRRTEELSDAEALLILVVFGGMLFHLIWEASSRYTMRYYIHLLPLAACGIQRAGDWAFGNRPGKKRRTAQRYTRR